MRNPFRKLRSGIFNFKSRNYLLYAIGEIVFIIIGILFALQINNFNERAKEKKLEREYLNGILKNLNREVLGLQGHMDVQKSRMSGFTILVKAFAEEEIRSDHNLLKAALFAAQDIIDYEPHRNIFDGMTASGNISLIRSVDLRTKIQEYYVMSDALVLGEVTFNENILFHQRQIFPLINNQNSLQESRFDTKWQARLIEEDYSFFCKEFTDPAVIKFANHLTEIKRNTVRIVSRQYDMQSAARILIREINTYLGVEGDDSSEKVTPDKNASQFISRLPHNSVPIDMDDLSEYLGTYEFVKSDNGDESFIQGETILITAADNHLVVTTDEGHTSHSYYIIDKDHFKKAMAFLFDDPRSRGELFYSRNENKLISALSLHTYKGKFQFKKVD